MRRTVILALAFGCGILVASAVPSMADDTITPGPTSQPGDPFGGQTVPPGPVFVITPGAGGSQLPPSSDPDDVQAQIDQDKQQSGGTPGAPRTSPTAGASDLPLTPGSTSSTAPGANQGKPADADASPTVWWAVGAGGLAVLALVVVLLLARRKRDRERPDSLNDHAS